MSIIEPRPSNFNMALLAEGGISRTGFYTHGPPGGGRTSHAGFEKVPPGGGREVLPNTVLTTGFAKKTMKTPKREIALAEQRKRDYLNRSNQ